MSELENEFLKKTDQRNKKTENQGLKTRPRIIYEWIGKTKENLHEVNLLKLLKFSC